MNEKSISDSKENFEIHDKNMPSSDTIERTVLSQYNFNYNVSENDGYDDTSQLVIDETYTSSQMEQSEKSENIIFPEQDMSVYECSQPETDANTITCPNRVIFSSEVMEFVNSKKSCDNVVVVDDNGKENIDCDDDVDRMITEINGNNSDDIECNKCDSDVTENSRLENDDTIRSLNKLESDSIGLELDFKEDDLSSEQVQAIDFTIATDESERPIRSLTPCLDEKSESETGEISDSNDNCSVPVILSKNVLNKIQIENDAVTIAKTTPVISSAIATALSSNFNTNSPATTPDAHKEYFRSVSMKHFQSLHSLNNEIDQEPIQFKKINKSTKDRNYRDQFCNGNSFSNKQASSFDTFIKNRPRLESESFSAIKKHLASDDNLSVTKTKRKVDRNDDEDSIEKNRKSSHKKLLSSSSSSSSKRHRRSISRTSPFSASVSASASSSVSSSLSSRLSTTIPLNVPKNIQSLNNSGVGSSNFIGGSNSRNYTPPIKHNIKVIVSNDRVQEKNSKKNELEKNRRHHKSDKRRRKQRRHRTSPTIGSSFITQLPQSKKVYSTGNNILVSLTVDPKTTSVTKTNSNLIDGDVKPIIVPNIHANSEGNSKSSKHAKHSKNKKKSKKAKKSKKTKKTKKSSSKKLVNSNQNSIDDNTSPKLSSSRILNTNIDTLKTLAIFDLEQSPVRELTPEPVPVIELSDNDEPCCKQNTLNKNDASSSGVDQLSTNQSSKKLRGTNTSSVEKESKPDNKMSESNTIESQLEHRLNQALNRLPSSLINTASSISCTTVNETTPGTSNKNLLNLATTPRSPDVYDPFEPTSSPVSSSSLNFYKNNNNNNNNEKSSIMKHSSSTSNHPIDSNKILSFSSDEVSSHHHKTNSHSTDLKSPHKTHHNSGSSGGNGRATNSTSEPHDSPYSPGMSDFDDIYDPEAVKQVDKIKLAEQMHSMKVVSNIATVATATTGSSGNTNNASVPKPKITICNNNFNNNHNDFSSTKTLTNNNSTTTARASNSTALRLSEENLRMLGQMPNVSNTRDNNTHDYVNKLNRQERVVEEVKFVLKPEYSKKKITKEQYKEILRKSVPKILHNRSGVINPIKIRTLILAYVKKYHYINKHGGPMCDTKSDN